MKDARTQTRSLTAGLIALIFVSLTVKADETRFLSQLHDFRIINFIALSAYYQYSASGDKTTLNEIVAAINNANSAMNAIAEDKSSALSEEQTQQLVTEFDKFKELMRQNINDVRQRGYPDLRLLSEMADQTVTLSTISSELYDLAREGVGANPDERVEIARSAAVMMARMMSKYSARSNSSVAESFQGADSELALDQQAKQFDQLVEKLVKTPSSGELKKAIDSVQTKWMFIRGSYINFNDNNVPFLIDHYSRGILKSLHEAIALLTA
ncbi:MULTISPECIES: hypothetical protein [Marinobacter]|jgi:hypothetical protein|uniref:hypothetical protein n=1 Tax=Marinobacter TaxID=2742 RepID=UPI0003B82046|nr:MULTISPECIES: hypothetical protein [unclassified Marinobacter]ERS87393.1 hypothetical protein Q672_13170 [Marinobacter sp. EVN1]MCE0760290.1 hypothetical protein [Marinobacter sp. G11]